MMRSWFSLIHLFCYENISIACDMYNRLIGLMEYMKRTLAHMKQ